MINFIARRIEKPDTLEEQREKYKEYFVYTTIYEKYRHDVNEKLTADGYAEVIV